MFNTIKNLFFLLIVAFTLSNCEREITVDLPDHNEKIVVEGSIESGSPPIVYLSRNFPYFGSFDLAAFQSNFVKGAEIVISDGIKTATLDEICWSTLSDLERQIFAEAAGIDLEFVPEDFDFCLYTFFDFEPEIIGEYGKTYTMNITTAEGENLFAQTTIPNPAPLDSVWYEPHNNPEADTLWRVYMQINDPDTLGNYYRYYTQQNDEPLYPGLNSVFDDLLINGLSLPVPIDRAQPQGSEFEFETYGYFKTGDTVRVRWDAIDQQTYTFWADLERLANSAGPFSSSTKVNFNIEGGIGIWAGYAISTNETFVIEE